MEDKFRKGILLDAPAKVNLGLYVGKKYKNRHRIYTIIAPISLCDQLMIKPNNENKLNINIKFNICNSGIPLNIPLEENSIYKAYQIVKSRYNIPGVDVLLQKNIPLSSGLGGESSDAATMLCGLALLFNLDVRDTMFDMGALLGSDTMAFLYNEVCLQSGLYTHIKPLHKSYNEDIYLLIPDIIKSSTKAMYEEFDKAVKEKKTTYHMLQDSYDEYTNVFEEISPVKELLESLRYRYQDYQISFNLVGSGNAIMLRGSDKDRVINNIKKEKDIYKSLSIIASHIE